MIHQAWEVDLSLWFQGLGAGLEPIMRFFTLVGFPLTYVLLIAILYWSVDHRLGQRFAIFVLVAGSVNEVLKRLFHAPRPYWVDSRIRPIGSASTSFGMPSGHAQTSVGWLLVGETARSRRAWIFASIMVIMIGLSRIYLGAHFTSQVLAGWALGGLMMIVFLRMERRTIDWMRSRSLRDQLMVAIVGWLLILLAGGGSVWLLEGWAWPELWSTNVAPFLEEDEVFDPINVEAIMTSASAMLGTAVGMILMANAGGHRAEGPLAKRGLRLVVGTIALLLVLVLPSMLGDLLGIPEEPGFLAWGWASLSTFLLLYFVFHPIPLIFRRLGLTG